jgi:hypothetical protein
MDPTMPCTSSGGIPKTVGRLQNAVCRLTRGDPPRLPVLHHEVDVGGGCGGASETAHGLQLPAGQAGIAADRLLWRDPTYARLARSDLGGSGGLPLARSNVQWPPGRLLQMMQEWPPGQLETQTVISSRHGCSVPIPVSRDGPFSTLVSTAVQGENAKGRGHREGVGQGAYCRPTRNWRKGVLYPYDSVSSSSAAGGRLANGSDCFDSGNYQLATCGERSRTTSHSQFLGLGPPTQTERHPERSPEFCEGRSEGSARFGQRLPARREGASEARGHPWESGLGMTQRPRGAPPWSAVRHREVDVGCSGGEAPRSERSEGSALTNQIFPARPETAIKAGGRFREITLRMTGHYGSSVSNPNDRNGPLVSALPRKISEGVPPWLAVRHREVDVGCSGGEAPRSERRMQIADLRLMMGDPPWLAVQHREVDVGLPPNQCRRHPEPDLSGEGSAITDQILRVCETTLRMTKRRGCGPPVYEGRCRSQNAEVRSQKFTLSESRSCLSGRVEGVEGRWTCKCFNITALRSRTSDAEHEFTRARSPGSTPMRSFRCSRGLQLLLMRPSSARGRVESDPRSDQTTHVTWGAFS